MNRLSVLYCESWDTTQHFGHKEDVCKMNHTLTISRTQQKEYELRIVHSYVDVPDGDGGSCEMPNPYPDLDKCVKCALESDA